ncbi:hypothetical protein AB0H82_22370 [Streptomyces sp. NPDC050732]|uniref:hypothetical protein n=1 Tax=Streptomyces sp. NPDC050732 TaxID=3154632 RepID=UPI00343CDE1C
MSDANNADPQRSGHPVRDKAVVIGVIGLVLAAIPIAWAIFSEGKDTLDKGEYVSQSDQACANYLPSLQSLGKEPVGAPAAVYTQYLQRRIAIIRPGLRDWGAVELPSALEEAVNDSYYGADSAAREYEIAINWGQRGNVDKANDHLDKAGEYATESIRKARSIGLKVCPVGF